MPIFAFLSTGENSFRKPSTNTWDLFADKCNGGVKLDLKQCKYVGDAAGRAKEWAPGKPRDFSCTDRMFAANIGIQFATPENFFLGQKEAPFSWGKSVDPATLGQLADHTQLARNYAKEGQELVLMVGRGFCLFSNLECSSGSAGGDAGDGKEFLRPSLPSPARLSARQPRRAEDPSQVSQGRDGGFGQGR